MKTIRAMLVRIRGLFRRKQLEVEMNEEMRAHVDALIERNLAAGMSPDEARFAASRAFGGVAQIAERARDERRSAWGEHLLQDLRYATRQLRRAPGLTAVTALTLALGIGANTAIFTVVNALMLRSLPVHEPGRLVTLGEYGYSYAKFDLFRERTQTLAGVFAVHGAERRMVATDFGASESEPITMQDVSGDYFSVLKASARLGRALIAEDDRAGAPRAVVVLSDTYWRQRFAGNAAVIGKVISVNDVPVTIVGVMPPGFFGVDVGDAGAVQLWAPLWLKTKLDDGFEAQRFTENAATSHWLTVMGRLRPDVSLEQARVELETHHHQWLRDQGKRAPKKPFQLERGDRGVSLLRGAFGRPLHVLWMIAGVVLAVACANVAGLTLARGAGRQREFAVRLAMGAGRWRLVRQLVTESMLLALLGGVLGLLFASWGARLLAHMIPGSALDVGIDPGVLGFATAIAAGTGILCGLAPALRFSRLDVTTAFKSDGAQLAGGSSQQLNRALIVVQIALSFILLAAAGLFVRTLQNLRTHDYGIAREDVAQFSLHAARSRTDAARAQLHRQMLTELEALPGVQSATISKFGLPGVSGMTGAFTIEGSRGEMEASGTAGFYGGARRFFETKGIRLIAGRDFDERDEQPNAPLVAVVSESLARKYFPDTNPLGRRIMNAEIVGVARDVNHRGVRVIAAHAIYLPYFRQPAMWDSEPDFVVRTRIELPALAASVREIARKLDRGMDVTRLGAMADLVEKRFAQERAIAHLSGFFSGLALLLSGIGLYGMLSYGVVRRTREIGVRIALGANTQDVLTLVLKQGLWLAVAGCVLGAIAAVGLGRLTERLLYGVGANDPLVLAGAVVLLLASALLACWLPARRATKVDPVVALRAE